jgi:hypothetical protein
MGRDKSVSRPRSPRSSGGKMASPDWNAIGEVLQGVGQIGAAVAIAFAAYIGRNTFSDWKRQKQEERRIEIAERTLTLAYRLRYDFHSVRSPLIDQVELDEAENVLRQDSGDWWDQQSEELKRRARTAQAIMNRLRRHHDDWQKIWELKPLALAFFGPAAEQHLDVFWQQYRSLLVDAESYADLTGLGDQSSNLVRETLFQQCEESRITQIVDAAVAALESELLPIVYSGRQAL